MLPAGPLLGSAGTTPDSHCVLCLWLQPISNADFIVPVEIDGIVHQVLLMHTSAGSDRCLFQVQDSLEVLRRRAVIQFK